MKRIIFVFAALFAVLIVNAQIDMVQTFPYNVTTSNNIINQSSSVRSNNILPCPFYIRTKSVSDNLLNLTFINPYDFSEYKSLTFSYDEIGQIYGITYDIFAVDKLAIFTYDYNTNQSKIFDEDGNVILTLGGASYYNFHNVGSLWQLLVVYKASTQIYTFSGDGSLPNKTTSVNSPSFSMPSTRKIMRDGQVLIETETNTYNLQGTELR